MTLDQHARDLLQESRRQELLASGRLRLREVAELVGLSKTKVRDDVTRGALTVVKMRCGTRCMFLVEASEARRYMAELFRPLMLPTTASSRGR